MKPLDVDLYFSHIAVKYSETAKGLDDLIASLKPAQRKKLVDELNALITGRKNFVNCMALTPGIKYKLEKYFRLDSVSSFYEAYKETLQDRIFKWKGQSYYYNGEKVERDVASKARLYMLVGNVYYRKCFHLQREDRQGVSISYPYPGTLQQGDREAGGERSVAYPQISDVYQYPRQHIGV